VTRDTFLSELLKQGSKKDNPASGKALYPPAPPHRKTLQEIKEFSKRPCANVDKVLDDLDESQIRDILKDASFDSETVTSIIGGPHVSIGRAFFLTRPA